MMLTRRFDRTEQARVPFLSALSMLGFGMSLTEAKAISKEVAGVVSTWRDVASAAGASQGEIRRMASAFEHQDLERALVL